MKNRIERINKELFKIYNIFANKKKNYMKKNYCIVKSCGTCKKMFTREEYDELDQYFCMNDKSLRPPCDSVLMGESPDLTNILPTEYCNIIVKWEKWADEHRVQYNGCCDEHEGV